MESFPAPWHSPSLTHSLLLWRHSSCLGFPSSGLLPGRPYQGFPFPVLFNRHFLSIFSTNMFWVSWGISSPQVFFCIFLGVWDYNCFWGQKKQFPWQCCLLSCHGWSWNVNRYRHSFVCSSTVQWCRNKNTHSVSASKYRVMFGTISACGHCKPGQLWGLFN